MGHQGVVPGLALAGALAALAIGLGSLVPVVGGPVFGIMAGVAAAWALRRSAPALLDRCRPGSAVAGRHVLQAAIVVMGLGLPLTEVLGVSGTTLPVMLGTLGIALAGAWLLGGLLRLHPETRLLIGVGTGICGASAIAAVAAVARPAQERVAQAMGTIFLFNVLAVLAYPLFGRLLGLSPQGFGLWAGTAINDTSSVVAAAYSFGTEAGRHAVVVKLARSLMIVPICLAVHAWRRGRRGPGPGVRSAGVLRAFPLFIVAFLAASALAAGGAIPSSWAPVLSWLGSSLITVALTGIGITLDPAGVRRSGPRSLLLGGLLGIAVGATSLLLQACTGRL
ncbi:putative sulfate exporter family transporter [Nonomuraea turkmeniaca]|uniref:Putative sulfate exporter family transporter n=1 Tax=Nonomuraea turkmeniaca TaxID=103838 RepID=A0A5S4FWR4_9ACTN|nr:putative sulfate exporter family transporter [Nonomuraea turkmeniaca]TMR25122.1 putative sulfate exporter family transporter [Nonomuraea turkmeniaca]